MTSEKARARGRAKYARRMARDPEGFKAKRRAIDVRYRLKKKRAEHPKGVHVELVIL
jgi:hypothetical protein